MAHMSALLILCLILYVHLADYIYLYTFWHLRYSCCSPNLFQIYIVMDASGELHSPAPVFHFWPL